MLCFYKKHGGICATNPAYWEVTHGKELRITRAHVHCLAFVVSLVVVGAASAQTFDAAVELQWVNLQEGQIVHQHIDIEWEIVVTAYAGNDGLAAFCTDLVQDGANPAFFDFPSADPTSVPMQMAGFVWPAGIGNPGEGGIASGYYGLQRGTPGAYNLVQIGGAQNSFGYAGITMGTDVNVEANVGSTPLAAASGSFQTPVTAGTYTFTLQDPVATVFDDVNTAPAASPAREAELDSAAVVSVSFVSCIGDIDHSGLVDGTDQQLLLAAYGSCDGDLEYDPDADLDLSGCIDLSDLQELLAYRGTQCL